MARDLDLDDLSDDDRDYIKQRPWLLNEIVLQGGDLQELGLTTEATADPRTIVRTPSVDSSLVGSAAQREQTASDEDEYTNMKKDELIAEIERRNSELEEGEEPLSTSGTKADLQATLRADDVEPDEDDA